jgi:PUA domain protein
MMAPGLLSAGGSLPSNLPQDQIVAIHAEGKAHACGIGRLVASSEEIVKAGKGVAVEVICWIGYVKCQHTDLTDSTVTICGRLRQCS